MTIQAVKRVFLILTLLAFVPQAQAAYICNFNLHTLESESVEVFQSNNAGAYYCEHAFCVNVQSATYSSRIGVDSNGEKLVGFLHVQPDEHLFSPRGTYSQGKRHQKTRFIMGAAIKGYFASLLESQAQMESYKILITGYDKFQGITNNPTHDFVSNEENIDAAMEIAFGSKQQRVSSVNGEVAYAITTDGKYKLLTIGTRSLPVSDQALNSNLPDAIRTFNPNAIISMGVGNHYAVEIRATDRGLTAGSNGFAHDPNSPPKH